MTDSNIITSMIIFNVNGLYTPFKIQILSDWIKSMTQLEGAYKKFFKYKDTSRLKIKGWEKIYQKKKKKKL